jgi:hypothetical protein
MEEEEVEDYYDEEEEEVVMVVTMLNYIIWCAFIQTILIELQTQTNTKDEHKKTDKNPDEYNSISD